MKLDEFIKEAVVEIMRGIQTADDEIRKNNLGSIYRAVLSVVGVKLAAK
jgi:hypothetical protein